MNKCFCSVCPALPPLHHLHFYFRIRKRGAKLLHTKAVLLLVVLLNSLDCVLVLSELVLDVSFVRGKP